MKHYLQITYRGWLERQTLFFDAGQCSHEVTPSGHLIVRCDKGIVYSAAPGMWHEAAVVTEDLAKGTGMKLREAHA